MKIAQLAPLTESVPPRFYGGTERVVSWLTDELVRRGHEVTLFASGDSRTGARLRAVVPVALRLAASSQDPLVVHLVAWVFPATRVYRDRLTGQRRRHHLHEQRLNGGMSDDPHSVDQLSS